MTDPAEGIEGLGGALSDDGNQPPVQGASFVVVILFLACLLPEIILFGADLGLWSNPRLRGVVIQYFGFWPGLLDGWQANYPFQSVAMFFTYGFLHAGVAHFVVNMLTLMSLGFPVAGRVGQLRFLAIYVASLFGGALGFALLAHTYSPMVGASGALFGLAGALLAWELADRRRRKAPLRPIYRSIGLLVLLNTVLWAAMHGLLAWQTHLGGFIFGWIAATYFDRPIFMNTRS